MVYKYITLHVCIRVQTVCKPWVKSGSLPPNRLHLAAASPGSHFSFLENYLKCVLQNPRELISSDCHCHLLRVTGTFENLLRVAALFMRNVHFLSYTHIHLEYGFKPIVMDMHLRTLLCGSAFFCTLWKCKKIIRLKRTEKQVLIYVKI